MANKPLSEIVARWIREVTSGTKRPPGQAKRSSPMFDDAIGAAYTALTDRAARWPDGAQREEARELADEVAVLLPRLKATEDGITRNAAVAAELYTLAARNFADLSRRIVDRAAGDAPLPTELAELRVLRSGILARLEPTDENQQQSANDGKAYATTLLEQVTEGRLNPRLTPFQQMREASVAVEDFDRYIARLIDADEWVLLAAAIRAIDNLAPLYGKERKNRTVIEEMAAELSERLGNTATKALAATPQHERTSAERAPTDILVHLTAALRQFADRYPEVAELKELQRRGQALFMAHGADRAAVDAVLEEAQALGERASGILAVALGLRQQLPPPGKAQSRGQQHDNLYGRVFETKFAAALVSQPPTAFIDACNRIGQAFANRLEELHDEDEKLAASSSGPEKPVSAVERSALKVAMIYAERNPRPWSRSVPAMGRMAEIAKTEGDYKALEAIIAFFDEIPETGHGILAAFSLMAQLSAELAYRRRPKPAWMVPAGRVYDEVITPQRSYELAWAKGKIPETDAVGITLLHQPTAAQNASPTPSVRPVTHNRIGKRQENTDFAGQESSDTMSMAHGKGLPYGTGVSGSTNMLLHLFHHLKETDADVVAEVPAADVVMMSAMLMLHDGGHSLHEVLWVANLLDRDCALGLDLGDPDNPNAFVSDYDAFFKKFDDDAAAVLRAAADQAYAQTQDYLEQHSAFADAGLHLS